MKVEGGEVVPSNFLRIYAHAKWCQFRLRYVRGAICTVGA